MHIIDVDPADLDLREMVDEAHAKRDRTFVENWYREMLGAFIEAGIPLSRAECAKILRDFRHVWPGHPFRRIRDLLEMARGV